MDGHPNSAKIQTPQVLERWACASRASTLWKKSALKEVAERATERNLEWLNLDMTQPDPESRAYLLANQVDPNGRIIAFVFTGEAAEPDGSSVYLTPKDAKKSINYRLLSEGLVYPLFYDTLFFDLRKAFAAAAVAARNEGRGLWSQDATNTGVEWGGKDSLALLPPIFPKLWRRLYDYTNDQDYKWFSDTLDAFKDYLDERNDRVTIRSNVRKTGLDDLVEVEANTLKLLEKPEDLIFEH